MEKRDIRISLDIAKELYRTDNDTIKDVALQAFTKEELIDKPLPTCTEELYDNYNDFDADYHSLTDLLNTMLRIRDIYRQGWKPNWNNIWFKKWIITHDLKVRESLSECDKSIFSFRNEENAKMFLKNFNKELKNLIELL